MFVDKRKTAYQLLGRLANCSYHLAALFENEVGMIDETTFEQWGTRERCIVGVLFERRPSISPWADHVWRATSILPGATVRDGWRPLGGGPDSSRFVAGGLKLEIFRGETESYRQNLSNDRPRVYVVLRRKRDDQEVVPFLVTVCPVEAQSYMENGEDVVEAVPMPPELSSWVSSFVERHHVPQTFAKRKRSPKRDEEPARDPFWRLPPVARR
jgi:Protein of unknown function (DUF3305)